MGSIGAAISRNRQQSETKNVYNPDLEYSQQGYADALYGRGAPSGGYGMSGGQFPTAGKDPSGFGSNTYGPQSFTQGYGVGPNAGNIYPGGAGPGGTTVPASYSNNPNPYGKGRSLGQPGSAGVQMPGTGIGGGTGVSPGPPGDTSGGGGGGYRLGPPGGGGGAGMGDYAAMQPYQFGTGGAAGDTAASGAAAYGGYQGLARDYGRMGREGVTGRERANLMAASNEAIQSNIGANRDIISNRVAQSGNSAGSYGALARLGAAGGQQLEAADRANQTAIMAENQRRKEAGLAGRAGAAAGQAGLYGTSSGLEANLLAGRGRLASLQRRGYTQGAGTGGTVSYSGSIGSMGGG